MQIKLDENDDLLPEYDLDFSKSKPNRFTAQSQSEDMKPHYDFDYSKARPNRFADAYKKAMTVKTTEAQENSDDQTKPEMSSE